VRDIVLIAHAQNLSVSIAGRIAGNPKAVSILAGLGLNELSVNIASIEKTKSIIRSIILPDAIELANMAVNMADADDVVALLYLK